MSHSLLAVVLAQIAAGNAPVSAPDHSGGGGVGSDPIAVSASASVTILPAVRFDYRDPFAVQNEQGEAIKIIRDDAGTYWFEFT